MQSNLMYRIKDNNAKFQTYVMDGNGNQPTTIKPTKSKGKGTCFANEGPQMQMYIFVSSKMKGKMNLLWAKFILYMLF